MKFQAHLFTCGVICGVFIYFLLRLIFLKVFTFYNTHIIYSYKSEDNFFRTPFVDMDPRLLKQIAEDQRIRNLNGSDSHIHTDKSYVASQLRKSVRVFCAIITRRDQVSPFTLAINATWVKRCDKVVYFTGKGTKTYGLPVVLLKHLSSQRFFVKRLIIAMIHIYNKHFTDAEWFLFSSDTAYVIMENLRHFLSDKNPEVPVIYGAHTKLMVTDFRNSMAVMSKSALLFSATDDLETCYKSKPLHRISAVDLYVALCMEESGIEVGGIHDEHNIKIFNIRDPRTLASPQQWFNRVRT